MFDKYKKYKIIAALAFIIVFAIFLLGNLKIQSVQSYQEQHKNNGYTVLQNMSDALSSTTQQSSKKETNSNETAGAKETQDKELNVQPTNNTVQPLENLEQSLSENRTNAILSQDLENNKNSTDENNGNQVINPDDINADNINPDGLDKTQSDNSANQSTSELQYITCSIEIRCDVAVEFKDLIKNEGIKNSIPSDGVIIRKTNYKMC